ncbi:MAG: MBL fold metallo-hydrolase [Armatimonadetes bacterium]|nr:MBL fold metallo-hydrolase [Armatimonadota bacterium]
MSVTVLGCGTSTGVPVIGCTCAVCRSPDVRNKRLRPSIVVEIAAPVDATDPRPRRILVDTTPDLRTQMLRAGITEIDAVIITHPHADHIFGMDDLRQFNFTMGREIPVYAEPGTLDHLRTVFSYVFRETQTGGGKPQISLHEIMPLVPFDLCGVTVTPLTVIHGNLPVTALKFGSRFAYVTDVSHIPDATRPHLCGLDTLILGTVRYEPHPTHFGLWDALAEIADVSPQRAYLTHLGHGFDYATLDGETPANVAPCRDGLTFTVGAHGRDE